MNVKIAKLSVDPGQNRFYRRLVEYSSETPNEATALESHFWLHRGTNAIVRLLFRSEKVPELRERL